MTTRIRRYGLLAIIVGAVLAVLGLNAANTGNAAPLPARASTQALQGYADMAPAAVYCGSAADRLYVTSASNGKIVAKEGGKADIDLWKYQDSCLTKGYMDVDYFWVPGGCDGTSQFGGKYPGNRTYGPLPGNSRLDITVRC